jgi:hypothetical protein
MCLFSFDDTPLDHASPHPNNKKINKKNKTIHTIGAASNIHQIALNVL